MHLSHLILIASLGLSGAFTPPLHKASPSFQISSATRSRGSSLTRRVDIQDKHEEPLYSTTIGKTTATSVTAPAAVAAASVAAVAWSIGAESAHAFTVSDSALPSAFVAYGHYLGLVLSVGCLVTEKLTVKAGMPEEDEKLLVKVDSVYGLAGLLVVVTGYFRVVAYGKGWDFYSHEPVFWLKLWLLSVMGAASFFPTTQIIKRNTGSPSPGPMSAKLAARMSSVINAELLAVASIPLAATLMSRGVGYAEWFPWQVGAAPTALTLVGLGYKYIKEALDWQEDEV